MKTLFVDPILGEISIHDIINYLEFEIEREEERQQELTSMLQEWQIDSETINYINEYYHSSYYLNFLLYCFENMIED